MKFRRECPQPAGRCREKDGSDTLAVTRALVVLPPAPPPWKVLDYGMKPHLCTLPMRYSYAAYDDPFQLGAKIQCAECGQKWELRPLSVERREKMYAFGYRGDGLRWEIEDDEPTTEETA